VGTAPHEISDVKATEDGKMVQSSKADTFIAKSDDQQSSHFQIVLNHYARPK
jgi:hypothetical protein